MNNLSKMPYTVLGVSSHLSAQIAAHTPRCNEMHMGLMCGVLGAVRGFANALPGAGVFNLPAGNPGVLEFANEMSSDGWVKLLPLGDHPNRGYIQRVTAEDIAAMVDNHNTWWRKLANTLFALPIYKDHPDYDPQAYPDHSAYGSITKLETRADGLYGLVALYPDGVALVNSGTKFISPYFLGNPDPKNPKVYHPFLLVSVGITQNPNIRGLALANSKRMNEKLRTILLTALALANTASDQEIEAALPVWLQKASEALTQLPKLQDQLAATVTGHQTALANSRTELDTVTGQAKTHREAFQAERKQRIAEMISVAKANGQITEAEVTTWANSLADETQFSTQAETLKKLAPRINTGTITGNLGNRNVQTFTNAQDRSDFFQREVAKLAKEGGLTYQQACAAFNRANKDFWPAK